MDKVNEKTIYNTMESIKKTNNSRCDSLAWSGFCQNHIHGGGFAGEDLAESP